MRALTVNHPEHGELSIGERVAGTRSVTCYRADGSTVVLSSRALNKLTGKTRVLKAATAPKTREDALIHVRDIISGWEGNEKLMLARDLMILAESYLV